MRPAFREGDLIETGEGLIFDVKGLVHPPGYAIAFVRYFPEFKGTRRRDRTTYGKVYSLLDRYALLEKSFPKFLVYDSVFDETLCEVKLENVKKHYKPIEKTRELRASESLDQLESRALRLAGLLKKEAKIPWSSIGITGSILARLHTSDSDIDVVVYGSQNCNRVRTALKALLEDSADLFRPYDQDELRVLFDFRSKDTATSFEDFVRTESRKVIQGKFMNTDYFMRFVKEWSEVHERYGDVRYSNLGYSRIRCTVLDDSESIFTPCTYKIYNVTVIEGPRAGKAISEIVSFRGRFCEHATRNETVIAQGKLERVHDERQGSECFRILLGNNPSDYMVLV